MVSIKDIALHCNVSVATVSKALNGRSDISPATRALVAKAATEMGYMPNSAARALKTNRTYNLGVLFVDETMSGLTHEYFSHVLDSFKVAAESRGYDITFINRNIGNRSMTYLEHCLYRGVDGVMVACIAFDNPEVLELVASDLPLVTIDHVFNNRPAIVSDNIRGMQELVRYLCKKGHRNIAYIHGEKTAVTSNRLASFYKTCEEFGIEVPDEYVRESIYHNTKSCAAVTKELLALKKRPTCIIFPDDYSSIGGLNMIRDAGLSIPDDISVAGYDGIDLSQIISPRLTTYHQDTLALGRLAAEHLVNLIEHPKTAIAQSVLVEGRLLEGRSVKSL